MYETVGQVFHIGWIEFKILDVREMVALEQKAMKVILNTRLANINDTVASQIGGNHLKSMTMALRYHIKDLEQEGY